MEAVEGEVVGGKISLRQLNNKAIQKLYELVDALDSKSEPELIREAYASLATVQNLRQADAEFWVDIPGYRGKYQVSNLGNVRSTNYNGTQRTRNMVLCEREGYDSVHLRIDGKGSTESVHRLVAMSFIPNPDNKPQVNHKNGDRKDNRVENLEWCTNSENMIHKHRTMGCPGPFYSSVVCVETGEFFFSLSAAARAVGAKSWAGGMIRNAIENDVATHGRHWRYATKEEKEEHNWKKNHPYWKDK